MAKKKKDKKDPNKEVLIQYCPLKGKPREIGRYMTVEEAEADVPRLQRAMRKKEMKKAAEDETEVKRGKVRIHQFRRRVQRYGLIPLPDEDYEPLYDVLYKGIIFRNVLTEINCDARAACRKARLKASPEYARVVAALDKAQQKFQDAEDALRKARQKTRTRNVGVPTELNEAVEKARAERTAASEMEEVARAEANKLPAVKAAFEKADTRAAKKTTAARVKAANGTLWKECWEKRKDKRKSLGKAKPCPKGGLYWGMYNLQLEAAQQAKSGPMDPKFHPWLGTGQLGCQIQHGLPVTRELWMQTADKSLVPRSAAETIPNCTKPTADVWAGSKLLQIDKPDLAGDAADSRVWDTTLSRSERRRDCRTIVKVRYDLATRPPAKFGIALHRPLPEDGVIKKALIVCTRTGPSRQDREWSIHLVIDMPLRKLPTRSGVVGIDLGWRLKTNGEVQAVRVAYYDGDDGAHGEILLPPEVWGRVTGPNGKSIEDGALGKASSLHSQRDTDFDDARDDLVAWLKKREASRKYVPKWLRDETLELAKWRSTRRLARLILHWGSNRFAGDTAIYERLEGERVLCAEPTKPRPKLSKEEGNIFALACQRFDAGQEEAKAGRAAEARKLRAEAKKLLAYYPQLLDRLVPKEARRATKRAARTFYRYIGWRKQDKHLASWEDHARHAGLLRRKEHYRFEIAKLADRYGTVVINNINCTQVARRAKTESETEISEAVRLQRTRAAPSTLKDIAKNAVISRGGCYHEVEIVNQCHVCGAQLGRQMTEHCTCTCGTPLDIDWNSAIITRLALSDVRLRRKQKAA